MPNLTADAVAANTAVAAPGDAAAKAKRRAGVRSQVRGSSLLLAGRMLAKLINLFVQLLIVRCLSKGGYGLFAYALQIVALVQACATFGLDRAITRYLPIYQERQEWGKLFGTVVMVICTVLGLGLFAALGFNAFHEFIPSSWIKEQRAVQLLLLLIFLAPLQAVDELLVGLFAVFANPKAIFFRKHVLAPSLKLAVVLVLVISGGDLWRLSLGYVGASLLGTTICCVLLARMIKQQNLLAHFDRHKLEFPWREVLAFTIPLLSSELVYVVMHTNDAVLLEHYRTVEEVASLRAVMPLALLNQLVMASFATLFTPGAARLFARGDRRGINDLYWQTGMWIAVLSFPIFALTFSLAEPITVLACGSRYHSSWPVLALLSLGHYFNAALGFNGLTLKVCGKLRYVVIINVLTALLNFTLALLLIPRYGAVGAAVGTCAALVVHNFLKQGGLALGTGVNLLERRYLLGYAVIAAITVGLGLVQYLAEPPIYVGLPLAALASLAVLRLNRHLLDTERTFPELRKVPLLRWMLGQTPAKRS